MRRLVILVCLLSFLAVCMPAQRMASTYPNLQAFIDSCPQNDPYLPIIQRDFRILRDQVPVGQIACTEPYSQMPATQITDELAALQVLRFMYYMDMGRSGYLPWTSLRLYDWMKSRISGINIDSSSVGGECCLIVNNATYISVGSLAALAAADGTTVAFQAQYRQTAIGIAANVGLYAHETRHTEGNGHPHVSGCPQFPTTNGCDETYDLTNLSPYGIQYYLAAQMLSGGINLGYSCDPATQALLGGEFESLADVYPGRFVTNAPPQLSLPADPGGACIPASTFTLSSVPSQVAAGANLTLGIAASNSQAGWTADSTVSWITPTAGMNSAGSGQAVFAVNPNGSTESGTVIAAGTTVSVNCVGSSCAVSGVTTIAFGPLSDVTLGTAPFTISATASSGLPVTFTSTTPAVCTVAGSTVTIVATGTCSITATQAGNATYSAATPVTQSFTVTGQNPQTIAFGWLGSVKVGVAPLTVHATASSGLAVSFASTTVSVCTVLGSTVTIVSEGTCAITASQAGNAVYASANSVTQSFPVLGASEMLWRFSATFADGGTAIGYFVFDPNANKLRNWDVSTTGGNTTVFFPFEFTPNNSGTVLAPGLTQVNFESTALYLGKLGLPENLDLVATLASPLSGAGGTINIAPNATGECFDCNPGRLITSGIVTTTGPLPPAVTVTPSASSITTAQPLTVTVAASGGDSAPTPTGSVTLTSGTYTSGAATLSSGSATIGIPAGSLATGTVTLTVGYTPDSSSSPTYKSATGFSSVTVTGAAKTTPTVTATPSASSISTTQPLTVTVAVTVGSGYPTPTGSVTLTSGSYSSRSATLSSGSATINVSAGSLAVGSDTLTVTYTPDSSGSSTYNSATGSNSVMVTAAARTTPTVTVTVSASGITTAQALSATVTVSGTPTPTGSVTLTGGGYTSVATTLTSGSASINIPSGSLAIGSDTLTASYTPDANSSATYNSATGISSVVSVTLAAPSGPPALVSPANGAAGVLLAPTLVWDASNGATSYDVYFGTSSTPPLAGNTTNLSYAPGVLNPGITYYWQIAAKNSAGSNPSGVWSFTTATNPTTGLHFVAVTPCRLADTRGTSTIAGGTSRDFAVPQLGGCGIPSTAQAYSLNVTAVPAGYLGYLTIWPTGQPRPNASTLNSWEGTVVANAAVVPAGTNGAVSVYVSDDSNVILDINGYFDTSSGPTSYAFYSATPCRVVDTRNSAGQFGGPELDGTNSRDFPIPLSSCPIPATARGYSLNFTVVPAGYLGFLTTWPTGQPRPNASTLNSWTGKVVANAAIVPAGTNESVSVYGSNATQLILDINGYFGQPGSAGALSFYPVAPCRVADTRNPTGTFGGPEMEGPTTRVIPIPASTCNIPSTAAAYSLNVTVVPDGPLSYLTIWPAGSAQPNVSTLNSFDGAVVANAAIVPAGTNGAIEVYVTNPTHVILDINGYFAP